MDFLCLKAVYHLLGLIGPNAWVCVWCICNRMTQPQQCNLSFSSYFRSELCVLTNTVMSYK